MEKDYLNSLEEEIKACKEKIKKLEPKIGSNSNIARVYNRLLVKKAALKKQYKMLVHKTSLKEKIKKLLKFHKKEVLICDYFKS